MISLEGSWRLRRIQEYYNCIHSPVAGVVQRDSVSLVPRPFPPPVFIASSINYAVFHTGNDEILPVGMAWERG